MLLKRILCPVPDPSRSAFAAAQVQWGALRGTPGFLGQVGGWSVGPTSAAVILAIWESPQHYEHFMTEVHDGIFQASRQALTYRRSSVHLATELVSMSGSGPHASDRVSRAGFLRTTLCHVEREHDAAFVEAQRRVWVPGMRSVAGMLGGSFGRVSGAECDYLVVTLWASEETHGAYVRERLSRLRKRAGTDAMLRSIEGVHAPLEDRWRVLP